MGRFTNKNHITVIIQLIRVVGNDLSEFVHVPVAHSARYWKAWLGQTLSPYHHVTMSG